MEQQNDRTTEQWMDGCLDGQLDGTREQTTGWMDDGMIEQWMEGWNKRPNRMDRTDRTMVGWMD